MIQTTHLLFIVAFSLLIGGCASPARVELMTASGSPAQRIAKTPLHENLSVQKLSGGEETNPMWKSSVSDAAFRQALEDSLKNLGWLALGQTSAYQLTVKLESLDQPVLGFDMTVTATVHYTLTDHATGKTIWDRSIATPYTAAFSASPLGVERLRLANEGAIRSNITKLIDELSAIDIGKISLN